MKTVFLTLAAFLFTVAVSAQKRDLPGPTANPQTVPAFSYVIAMDNSLQQNASANFNLKVYGLIIHLLNNGMSLKWSIKTGKAKDGVDFTATAQQILPTSTAASSRNFKAGPFVIYAVDTTGFTSLYNSFNSANGLTGNDRPRIYKLTGAVANVDIRYDMAGFRPKGLILNDGGNQAIHTLYMTMCSVPAANYATGVATDLITKCYTFASEPHNTVATATVINSIRRFVEYGGNFLAQCAAIETYENSSVGHFHTTNGITITNTAIATTSNIYPNADLAYSQFEGAYDLKVAGSVSNWTPAGGSVYQNNEHNHTTGGTIVTQTPVGMSVAKLTGSTLLGGLVFYLGNHEYKSATTLTSINGIRAYMNAFLTPVSINLNCNTGTNLPNPLPVKLMSFNAMLNGEKSGVQLNWKTAQEISASHFEVERSTDGREYQSVGLVMAVGNTTEISNYLFNDNISRLNSDVIYYRLRQVDVNGKSEYSETRIVRIYRQGGQELSITTFPNPASTSLNVTVPSSWQSKHVVIELVSPNGQVVGRKDLPSCNQTETLNIASLQPGLYIMKLRSDNQVLTGKIIKQ